MNDRVASSCIWSVAIIIAACVVSGCGSDERGTNSQSAADASVRPPAAGDPGIASQRARAGSDASAAGSAGAHDAAGSGGKSSTATPEMMDDGAATWSSIYTNVFWSCTNASCHGGNLAEVNFATKDAAWESLVNKPANAMYPCAQLEKQRVVPGDPNNSLLYLKLDINSPCGQQMPPGGQLSESARDRVRDWILMGAKND